MAKANNTDIAGMSLEALSPELRARYEKIEKKNNSPEPAKFSSKDFNGRVLAFFLEDDFEQIKEHISVLCEELKNINPDYAQKIIKRLTDKFISPVSNADSITLTRLGIQLGSCGYEKDSLRCADRVDELLGD